MYLILSSNQIASPFMKLIPLYKPHMIFENYLTYIQYLDAMYSNILQKYTCKLQISQNTDKRKRNYTQHTTGVKNFLLCIFRACESIATKTMKFLVEASSLTFSRSSSNMQLVVLLKQFAIITPYKLLVAIVIGI